jgi:hypothetical protein
VAIEQQSFGTNNPHQTGTDILLKPRLWRTGAKWAFLGNAKSRTFWIQEIEAIRIFKRN